MGKRIAVMYEYRDPNVSSRAKLFSLGFFLFFPVFTLRSSERWKTKVDDKAVGGDGRPGKVTVTFSRYVTVNLLGFV